MTVRQHIPEGLAQMPPGAALAGVLAGLDLSRLAGLDLLEVVRARYRQATHERARLLAAVAESGLVDLGPDDELPRRAAPDQYAADEIRAALVLTRRAAEGLCAGRLPGVAVARGVGGHGRRGLRRAPREDLLRVDRRVVR